MVDIEGTAKRVLTLAAQATPGPWQPCEEACAYGIIIMSDDEIVTDNILEADAAFVAAVRTDGPALATEVLRLRRYADAQHAELKRLRMHAENMRCAITAAALVGWAAGSHEGAEKAARNYIDEVEP